MKRMMAKSDGMCDVCEKIIRQGADVVWSRSGAIVHEVCVNGCDLSIIGREDLGKGRVYLSSCGWGDFSPVTWDGDLSLADDAIILACRGELDRGIDVDLPNPSDDEILEKVNKERGAAVMRLAVSAAREKRLKKIRQLARETGEAQVLRSYMSECDDPEEQCSLDYVTVLAMPDGTTKTNRQHTW